MIRSHFGSSILLKHVQVELARFYPMAGLAHLTQVFKDHGTPHGDTLVFSRRSLTQAVAVFVGARLIEHQQVATLRSRIVRAVQDAALLLYEA